MYEGCLPTEQAFPNLPVDHLYPNLVPHGDLDYPRLEGELALLTGKEALVCLQGLNFLCLFMWRDI